MKHLDLFSGLGTFAFAETNPWAGRVLAHQFPDIPNLGDVGGICRRLYDCKPLDEESGEAICPRCGVDFGECACIGTDQFTDTYGFPDIITGGFPCVDITNAKNAVECPQGIDGTESGLWREMWRIASELRPRYIVVENAAALTFRGLDRVLGDLAGGGMMRSGSVWALPDLEHLTEDCAPLSLRTPTSRDWKGMSAKSWRERSVGDTTPTLPDQLGGIPNPEFVEWMMGLPRGASALPLSETGSRCRSRNSC